MEIRDGKERIEDVKSLIIEYTQWLDRDLSFQNIDDELNNLEGKYCPPQGELLIAVDDDRVLGMIAYHRYDEQRCEMKRLYVKPEARKNHIGQQLIQEIIKHAKDAGFQEMVLDTIEPLQAAIHLYHQFGFEECVPYYDNPMEDVIYMKKSLL